MYHGDFLSAFSTLPQGRLEQLERLEQLRALENGYAIAVGISDQPTVGINSDTDIDIVLVDELLIFLIDDCVDRGIVA